MTQELFGSDEDARLEVKRGKAWGAMIFQSNYSAALVERTEQGRSADDYTIEASDIGINLDMSSEFACSFSSSDGTRLMDMLNNLKFSNRRSTNRPTAVP